MSVLRKEKRRRGRSFVDAANANHFHQRHKRTSWHVRLLEHDGNVM